MYDFLASQTLVTPDPSSPQDATVVGVGFRVVIKAKNVSGSASLSLGGVAAAATVQGAETSLKVAPIGLGTAAFAYLSQLGADPDFDIGTTVVLGQATGELIDFLTDPANLPNLQPRPVAIMMNEQSVETAATSFGFGLRAIQYGDPRSVPQDATPNKLPDGVEISDSVIMAVYHNIVGSDALSTPPSTQQADKAKALTHTGP